ncbi:DUF5677 domain-containing protein [Nonomuraea polychroma]|uniref:DUF5677 domain-containing protein n=1 Tax=Nonomuraea polychroma TaxID=46176 RepID=UPI003D94EBD4
MTYQFGDNPRTHKRAIPLTKHLLAEADNLIHSGSIAVSPGNVPVFPLMVGWWRHVNATAADYLTLVEAGSTVTLTPLFRSIVEHTYKMIWLADVGADGVTVVEHNTWKQRRILIEGMRGRWTLDDDIDVGELPAHVPADRTTQQGARHYALLQEFTSFNKLTAEFGSEDMYDVYRHLCDFTHPTGYTADAYLRRNDDGTVTIRARAEPRGRAEIIWLPICLLQAGLVTSALISGDPFRKVVDKAARDYGVPVHLLVPQRSPAS